VIKVERTCKSKSPNLRKIEYYTPYSRQVLPKRRKMVRMNFQLSMEEDLQWKMYTNMEELQEQNGIHGNRMISR
jgi:hypothetical protein